MWLDIEGRRDAQSREYRAIARGLVGARMRSDEHVESVDATPGGDVLAVVVRRWNGGYPIARTLRVLPYERPLVVCATCGADLGRADAVSWLSGDRVQGHIGPDGQSVYDSRGECDSRATCDHCGAEIDAAYPEGA